MRMWLCDPKILCRKHLLGEHVELHMFIGTLRKKIKVDGYLRNNCFEPRSIFLRHKLLVEEMIKRGYNHKTPIEECDCECVLNLTEEQQYWEVNKDAALNDLINRCPECYNNYAKSSE